MVCSGPPHRPRFCSLEEVPSVFRPQHSFAPFVHTDDMAAGRGPCHCIDRRASKGEGGSPMRPQGTPPQPPRSQAHCSARPQASAH